ncbi:Integrase core domain protein [Sporomusa ovata DSM 2662]|uniref:Integrase, catalytic region n=1 Tax=Sporomusa ovata TaxID=2378 RepID=A0A0U1L4T6_9FIRM|nr:IS481 family transposase [Sporomusa ovata]EQB25328.1 putative ISSod13, transposase [Sporomusa ovata DSM 2662]CQR73894.1 Integrase, catalytic region [Sporomusa ovata]
MREGWPLTPQEIRKIEQYNPCFKERQTMVVRPGELLVQDFFYAGTLTNFGQIYLHAVVDMYSSFAFGLLYAGKTVEGAVAVLRNAVLPFYRARKISIGTVFTDNGQEFGSKESRLYESFLTANKMEHRCTAVHNPKTNGFIERFKRTVLNELFGPMFSNNLHDMVEELQADFAAWLRHYNYERPHVGFRNLGKCPIEMMGDFKP